MRMVCTRLDEKTFRRFKELVDKEGRSIYIVLKELIMRYLAEHGEGDTPLPLGVRIEMLEKRVKQLEDTVSQLVRQSKTSIGMDRFVKRR